MQVVQKLGLVNSRRRLVRISRRDLNDQSQTRKLVRNGVIGHVDLLAPLPFFCPFDGSRAKALPTDLIVSDRDRLARHASYPAVLIALNTCMRYSEIRLLTWEQVDLNSCTLTVGHSKTESGTGRLLPLNDRAVAILSFWASLFPLREPNHFVFPAERYGASGHGATVIYDSDPTKPIGRWT